MTRAVSNPKGVGDNTGTASSSGDGTGELADSVAPLVSSGMSTMVSGGTAWISGVSVPRAAGNGTGELVDNSYLQSTSSSISAVAPKSVNGKDEVSMPMVGTSCMEGVASICLLAIN